MAMEPIEIVEHTADWSLRVRGEDLSVLFEHAALGMAMLLVEDPGTLPLDIERDIELEAYDAESLLVGWLDELAYWAESERLIIHDFEIREIEKTHLAATVRGGKAPTLEKHIKAVTFHNLAITAVDSGLEVTIVFDV